MRHQRKNEQNILVGNNSVYYNKMCTAAAFQECLKLGEIVFQAMGIVPDVRNYLRIGTQPFPSSVEIHSGRRLHDGILHAFSSGAHHTLQSRHDRTSG